MAPEMVSLWGSLVAYVLSGSAAVVAAILRRRWETAVLVLLLLALALLTLSIGLRWERLGHGPFITMFEILLSNLWSLSLVYLLAYWRIRPLRPTAAVVLPLLFLVMAWILVVDPADSALPPTYHTVWLWVHVGFGKVFLGATLVAVGLAGVILGRRYPFGQRWFARMPADAALDELAYRFMALGLVFDSLMLIAGAIWAQDAWGRYWAWDPLETWSFITWLLLALAIHVRITYRPSPTIGGVMVIVVFAVGFVTFIGIPFITPAPHKGVI